MADDLDVARDILAEPHMPRCPRCGSVVLSFGDWVWCPFAGDQRPGGRPACDYGIGRKVTIKEHESHHGR